MYVDLQSILQCLYSFFSESNKQIKIKQMGKCIDTAGSFTFQNLNQMVINLMVSFQSV